MQPDQEKTIRVLYVDDEIENLNSFRASFRRYFEIFTASSAEEAVKVLTIEKIHVLITDQKMPGMPGTQLLEHAVKTYPNQARILITGHTDIDSLIYAIRKGHIYDFVRKPWDTEDLIEKIKEAYLACAVSIDYQEKLKQMEDKIKTLEDHIRRVLEESDNS